MTWQYFTINYEYELLLKEHRAPPKRDIQLLIFVFSNILRPHYMFTRE